MQSQEMLFCNLLDRDFKTATASTRDSSRRTGCERMLRARAAHPKARRIVFLLLLSLCTLPFALTGCGGASIKGAAALTGPVAAGSLQASPTSVSFGSVPVGQKVSSSVSLLNQGTTSVQVSTLVVTGQAFSVSGAGDLPITVAAGGTYNLNVNFAPTATGTATGQLMVTGSTAGSTANSVTVDLSGTGSGTTAGTAVLSALSCTSGSMTGAGTDSCTVTLTAAAPTGGVTVTLGSNNGAVSVPASVSVAAGATTASFTATVAAVASSQAVTLSANAGGISETFSLQLNASTSVLSVSSANFTFGNVVVGSPATQTLTLSSTGTAAVTVNSATVNGTGFTVSGATFPLTLNPNQTATLTVQFDPTATGSDSGTLTLTSNSSTGTSTAINLSGTGVSAVALAGLACTSGSITGAGTDSCTVTLNAAAATGGFAVSLASNNTAVTVPASVTVAAGSSKATFTATVSAVSTAQAVTLTASANSVSETFSLQLVVGVPTLTVNATTIAFGDVSLNVLSTQSVTLTSSGTAAVTVSSAVVSGTGFTVSGATFPLTLNPGQTATLTVQFDPTTAVAVTGQLTIVSNSSVNPTDNIILTGTGDSTAYEVNLTWDAPTSSSDPVASYNVYRAPTGSTSYQQINSSTVTTTAYTDTSVLDGQVYDYIVESVDAAGATSSPSNMAAVTIP